MAVSNGKQVSASDRGFQGRGVRAASAAAAGAGVQSATDMLTTRSGVFAAIDKARADLLEMDIHLERARKALG